MLIFFKSGSCEMKVKLWVIRLVTWLGVRRSVPGDDAGPSVTHLVMKRELKGSTYLQNLVSAGVLENPQLRGSLDY